MPEISVQVRDKRYYHHRPFNKAFCQKMVLAAWETRGASEVSVVLADNEFVHILNRDYRGKDKPTNVLSFENAVHPPSGQPWLAGDIIIAYETVRQEAKDLRIPFLEHLAHLIIHGTLHLQGYDHLTDKDAENMEAKEISIMKKLGYQNPYQQVE
ncbi:MAG: rRNA maturation RNase YbeY [Pseudomonadota bacterium]|nr:rRNA maturation RNase YbeY [Pseudomonadota bacterium]